MAASRKIFLFPCRRKDSTVCGNLYFRETIVLLKRRCPPPTRWNPHKKQALREILDKLA